MAVDFGGIPPAGQEIPFILRALKTIEEASLSDAMTVADEFIVSNVTETRTLDCATATLADVRNVLGTFLMDLKKRGSHRADF